MDGYVLSDSGIKVWTTPYHHPLLKGTDTEHPAFRDKLAETYSKGKVKGLPRILSENSEDARTWYYFSPLLNDESRKTMVLTELIAQAFPEVVPSQVLKAAQAADLEFWPKIESPSCRPQREGPSEPDVVVRIGREALLLVEAKYQSDVSDRTTYDGQRDQVIRLIDVGSWHARQARYDRFYLIVLQYGDAQTNAERIVSRYAGKPETISQALPYRSDLTVADLRRLSRSVAFARWPNPMK